MSNEKDKIGKKLDEWLSKTPFEGVLTTPEEDERGMLHFPIADTGQAIAEAFLRLARKSEELEKAGHPDPMSVGGDHEFVTEQVAIPIPFSKALLLELETVEERMLNDHRSLEDCAECRSKSPLPNHRKCHGVFKKGDLLRSIVASLAAVAMREIVQTALEKALTARLMQDAGDRFHDSIPAADDRMRETSASEVFNPVVRGERKIIH